MADDPPQPARPPTRPEITEFWDWWRGVAADIERDLDTGGELADSRVAALEAHLARVADGLSWELGRDAPGGRLLVITANGEDLLFAPAARLVAAAPHDDPAWRFLSSRQPWPLPSEITVVHEGRQYRLDAARFSITEREDEGILDIRLDHPALRGRPLAQAQEVSFLLLDALLGEDAVERHIGMIDLARVRFGARGYDALQQAVERMARRRADQRAQGIEGYAFLDTARDGLPGVATVMLSRRHRDYPTFDTRAELRIALRDPTPKGFPTDAEAEVLHRLRSTIEERLGDRGVITSRDTHAGWLTLHIAFDGDGATGPYLERFPDALQRSYAIEVEIIPDPGWDHARGLLDSCRGRA